MKRLLFSCALCITSLLTTSSAYSSFCSSLEGHRLWVGPEMYHVRRSREGGSVQTGTLGGGRFSYDFIKRYNFYVGAEGAIATGSLEGRSNGTTIRSTLTDKSIEARFGYTFQAKCDWYPLFTPFFGYGYFWENNHFHRPRTLRIHFDNRFSYIPVGFLSEITPMENFTVGLNFKARVLLSGEVKSSNDPDFDDGSLLYKHKLQYRIDLPLSYYFCYADRPWRVTVNPFYEMRHYGYHPNYPFDFLDTKFRIYGVNLQFYVNY